MVLSEACARDCTLHNLLNDINEKLKNVPWHYLETLNSSTFRSTSFS